MIKERYNKHTDSTYVTKSELIDAAVGPDYLKTSQNNWNKYKTWMSMQCRIDTTYPKLPDIIETYNIRALNRTLMDWAVQEFNDTKNIGSTIQAKCRHILHHLNHYNMHVSLDFMPGISKICKGMNRIAHHVWKKNVDRPKRALLQPMIRAMLKLCTNDNDRLRIIFPYAFMLRAQHYVYKSDSDKPWLLIGNLQWGDINPNTLRYDSLTIHMGADKNHQFGKDMQRTVYCCCHTNWPDLCAPCMTWKVLAKQIYSDNRETLQLPVIRDINGKHVSYKSQLRFIQALCKKLKLPVELYGTHSLRAARATESFLTGKTAIEIQVFGNWENIGSVIRYVRPNNPDLEKFGYTVESYTKIRKEEEQLLAVKTAKRDWRTEHQQKFIDELKKQQQKQQHGKRNKQSKYHYMYMPALKMYNFDENKIWQPEMFA